MSENITLECSVTHPIHLAADKKSSRGLAQIEARGGVKPGEAFLTATDGCILAIVKETGTADFAHKIPLDVTKYKAAESCTVQKNGQWMKHTRVKNGPISTTTVPASEEVRFPNTRDILPDITQGRFARLRINPSFLSRLAEALGNKEEIEMYLPLPSDPNPTETSGGQDTQSTRLVDFVDAIGVTCLSANGWQAGAIMPIEVNTNTKDKKSSESTSTIGYSKRREEYMAAYDKQPRL